MTFYFGWGTKRKMCPQNDFENILSSKCSRKVPFISWKCYFWKKKPNEQHKIKCFSIVVDDGFDTGAWRGIHVQCNAFTAPIADSLVYLPLLFLSALATYTISKCFECVCNVNDHAPYVRHSQIHRLSDPFFVS